MIKTKNISMHYGSSQVLFDINIDIKKAKITSLMGSNGVGKTSFLKLLSGIHTVSSGEFYFDNKNVTKQKSYHLAKMGIGYVPQGRFIFPLLTVKENLEIGFSCLKKEDHFIPDEIFELFPVLKKMIFRRGGDLSGGQQQQLAIARALITKPKLLLMDEPTEGIQPNIIKMIGEIILYLKTNKQMSIFLVEQYFEFAFNLSDYIYVMRRGKIICEGEKKKLKKSIIKKELSIIN
jgi:urea transport system ATP-binding protein|tara:strand:+ start:1130 stop:1831 length:702 start_codon:yes stop_codon:yes gene_type:complete